MDEGSISGYMADLETNISTVLEKKVKNFLKHIFKCSNVLEKKERIYKAKIKESGSS